MSETIAQEAVAVRTLPELARLLRHLRRREARRRESAALTYRELAAKTGWSHAIIGEYLTGTTLPPTDRFDLLIQILGAAPSELGPLATARDRVEEHRRPVKRAALKAVPRQLPAAVPGFVGRQAHLAELDRLVDRACGLVVAAICGSGGVGKTALAVEWAHRRADRFPDGHLYIDLHGYAASEPLDSGDALARFLYAVGANPAQIPAGTPERSAQFRTMLAERRMLIVLDNAICPEQVRPLLPGSPQCMVVITSRDSLAGLVAAEGAYRVDLDVLSEPEAVALLRTLLGDRVEAAPEDARALVRQCGRLPLAIRVAAELAASRSSLSDLVRDLQQARLDLLDGGDERSAVRSVLSWSYWRLSPGAARLFRLFGCEPGPQVGVRAAASLAGLQEREARLLLGELCRAHILTEAEPGRFTLHDVLRAYATELAYDGETEADRRAAVHRLLDHYLQSAVRADRFLDSSRVPVAIPDPVDGVAVADVDTVAAARFWFETEHAALLAAVRLAADHDFTEYAWLLPWAMANFLDGAGYWQEWAAVARTALDSALHPVAMAQSHKGLARAATRLRRFKAAAEHYERASVQFGRIGDDLGRASVHVNLSELYLAAERVADALTHQQRALALFRGLGHLVGQAKSLNNLGYLHALQGQYRSALAECGQSLALWYRLGDRGSAAPALDSLGYVHHRIGNHGEAIAYYQAALALHRETGHRLYQASVLTHLGDVYRDAGRPEEAAEAWRAAQAIHDELDQ